MKKNALNKLKKLSSSIGNKTYKGYILSIARRLTTSDKIEVSSEELLKLVDPKRVEYDSESAIGNISVVSEDI